MNRKNVFALLVFAVFLLPVPVAGASQPSAAGIKKADKLYAARNYREAIELYQQVLASGGDEVLAGEVHTKIADSYFQLADYPRALASYRSALREQTRAERPNTQYWIGFCCYLTGRDGEAVAELLKVPELYPDSGMLVATSYYWAGRASERMGRKDQAAEYYKKAGGGNGKSAQSRQAMKRAEAVRK